jgi:hypothetical protein
MKVAARRQTAALKMVCGFLPKSRYETREVN